MAITNKQIDEMLEAAKPLMKWLAENYHPHAMAIVHAANVELLEGIATAGTIEFVDALPRLFNGKIDKKALRAPFWAREARNIG